MLLDIIHYLHLLSAVIWGGGTVIFMLVIFPGLARLPAAQARDTFLRIRGAAGTVMAISGGATLLFGLARAWIGGGIRGLGDLTTGYGITVLIALALWLGIEAVGGPMRGRFARLLEDPAAFEAEAPALVRRAGWITVILMALLIAAMAALGLGRY